MAALSRTNIGWATTAEAAMAAASAETAAKAASTAAASADAGASLLCAGSSSWSQPNKQTNTHIYFQTIVNKKDILPSTYLHHKRRSWHLLPLCIAITNHSLALDHVPHPLGHPGAVRRHRLDVPDALHGRKGRSVCVRQIRNRIELQRRYVRRNGRCPAAAGQSGAASRGSP